MKANPMTQQIRTLIIEELLDSPELKHLAILHNSRCTKDGGFDSSTLLDYLESEVEDAIPKIVRARIREQVICAAKLLLEDHVASQIEDTSKIQSPSMVLTLLALLSQETK